MNCEQQDSQDIDKEMWRCQGKQTCRPAAADWTWSSKEKRPSSITVLVRSSLDKAREYMISSTVSLARRRMTFTGLGRVHKNSPSERWTTQKSLFSLLEGKCNDCHLFWPMRWLRAAACKSFWGLKSLSIKMTVSAAVRFIPTPPEMTSYDEISNAAQIVH